MSQTLVLRSAYTSVAYLECAKGWAQRVWGTEVPQWSRGKAAVGGLGDEVPQKLTLFCY